MIYNIQLENQKLTPNTGRLKKQRQKLRRSLSLSDIKSAKDKLDNRHTMSCSDLTRVTRDDEFDIIRRQLINRKEKNDLQVVGDVKPPVCKELVSFCRYNFLWEFLFYLFPFSYFKNQPKTGQPIQIKRHTSQKPSKIRNRHS